MKKKTIGFIFICLIGIIIFGFKEAEDNTEKENSAIQSTIVFNVYGVDSKETEVKKETELRIARKDYDIKESLESILNTISEEKFEGLKIDVKSIVNEDEKSIVNIDLRDIGNKSFKEDYFKGVEIGGITESILIENVLQREFEGEWIDGVRFTYNGEKIKNNHIPLLEYVNYR
ncbi:hypothetical protein M4I33_08655 [Clostridium sp. LY3-2]|uniref:hypothetical protein n=1 Tax=Clostridium sp. LY3-2 TaxID=2942482 RepID=UPI0021520C37|nr:hypothetical protein [Clostridium sp. LY3-2]MCR6514944.1 hypothetical protein [Clostridium sp. LY3-2]